MSDDYIKRLLDDPFPKGKSWKKGEFEKALEEMSKSGLIELEDEEKEKCPTPTK